MTQIYPNGTRVRYTGTDAHNIGAIGTVTGMHESQWLHIVEFDKPLRDSSGGTNCPFTGLPYTRASVAPHALEPLESDV